MKRLLVLLSVILVPAAFASAATFSDQLQALQKTGIPETVQKFITDSYSSNQGDPQYFVASANYWWGLSQQVNISTKRPSGDDLIVADQKTGKPVGSLSSAGRVNPKLTSNAIGLLQDGAKRFPYRLDIGVGLAYMLRDQHRYQECVDTLKGVLTTAASHPEDVRWKDGNPPRSPWKQFLPASMQDYNATFYQLQTKEGDQLCQELSEAIVKAYPDHPYAYNMLAALSSGHGDEKGCIKYLQTALEKAPDDTLVMFNLGDAYKRTGDKAAAKRCYEKILSHGAPDDLKADAKKAIAAMK